LIGSATSQPHRPPASPIEQPFYPDAMPPELVARIRSLRGHVIERRGERIALLPQRAIWWPAQSILIVADVHFGKAESYRRLGAPIPGGILEETLDRLDSLLAATAAQRMIVLGDLVHGRDGLTDEVVEIVAAWIEATAARITLVEGNHDRSAVGGGRGRRSSAHAPVDHAESIIPPSWRIETVGASLEIAPFRFVHEPGPARGRYTLAGHLHPTIHLRGRGDSLRLPCFHLGPRVGVLPAFTPFSRGATVAADEGDIVHAIADGELFPIAAGDDAPMIGFDGMGLHDDDSPTVGSE